jgi:hypothetical protein
MFLGWHSRRKKRKLDAEPFNKFTDGGLWKLAGEAFSGHVVAMVLIVAWVSFIRRMS